jgi:hypothetical protein
MKSVSTTVLREATVLRWIDGVVAAAVLTVSMGFRMASIIDEADSGEDP